MVKDTLLGDIFNIWFSTQTQLASVIRWSVYVENNENLRRQSSLHHQYSVCVAVLIAIQKLKSYCPNMDSELLKDAFMIHDIPEGMLDMEYDVLSGDKKQSHDLSEYLIFRKNFEHFDESLFSHLHQAFLLQFAHKNDEDLNMFPDDAIAIMKNLRMMHPYIVLLFPALERWEYLFYAYEGYVHHDDVGIFVNVLRAQVPHLQGYASTIDGFREVLFTKQFEDKCLEFMERNSEIPVVKKIKKS